MFLFSSSVSSSHRPRPSRIFARLTAAPARLLAPNTQDLSAHEKNECGARLISCPKGCGDDGESGDASTPSAAHLFQARALDVHLKYDCAFRLVKCAACGDRVAARELDAHKRDTCRSGPVPPRGACERHTPDHVFFIL